MIFVTLGSQKFQFNRLLIEMDRLIENKIITEEVFAQIGASDYLPKYYKWEKFLDSDEFVYKTKHCDLFITHGGTGAIIRAVKEKKKVIAVPRRAQYGEHVDDHQIQLLKQFDEMGIIEVCYDVDNLEEAFFKVQTTEYKKYISNTREIIHSIDNYLSLCINEYRD